MAFNSLSGLLKNSARKRGISSQVEAAMVLEFFSKAARERLGAEVMQSVRPLYLKDKTLTVAALNPATAQELKLYELDLMQEVNRKAGIEVVTHLRFLS